VKKKLKIGQHLPKLWAIKYRVVVFIKHGVLAGKTVDRQFFATWHKKRNAVRTC